ncbi:uncharacterized protein LOC142627336 [Castanea sativa]|uniref:uncharacterized protein LOC142627336 n=1 Tax=Castanea sativa TaxID=21020 RepID=UPI003F6514E0
MIKVIPVSERWVKDLLIWPLTPDGNYSVRSAYCMLMDEVSCQEPSTSSPEESQQVWKGIWKIWTPNRIFQFIWRATRDSLPTKLSLKARHLPVRDICELCGDFQETTLHSLWLCEHAQAVWKLDINFVPYYKKGFRSFFNLLEEVLCRGSTYHVALFSTMAWCLWQRRNRLRMSQSVWPLHEIGLGVVIRDGTGHVIATSSQKIRLPHFVETTEVLAALQAIVFAKELSVFKVVVEGDCLKAVQALKAREHCNTLYGTIIEDAHNQGASLQACHFQHVRRESNKLAHALARRAVLSADFDVWVEELPSDLEDVFLSVLSILAY